MNNALIRSRVPASIGRFGIASLALVFFLLMVVIYQRDQNLYFIILKFFGVPIQPLRTPFIDTRFVTAQVECWSRGIDVYVVNPCDPLGRLHDYSPLWLRMPFLAISDHWTPVLGILVDLVFLFSLFLLPIRLNTYSSFLLLFLGVTSFATMFAVERGNTDLLIFSAAALAARLQSKSCGYRIAGYVLVLAVGLLKFYPLSLLIFVWREKLRLAVALTVAASITLLWFGIEYHVELARLGANVATGNFGGMFGARGLPYGTSFLLDSLFELRQKPGTIASWTIGILMPACFLLMLTIVAVSRAIRSSRSPDLWTSLEQLSEQERPFLSIGAILMVGCFFAHQNIAYRAVLLLLVLPGLLAMSERSANPSMRRILMFTSGTIVMALWAGRMPSGFLSWFAMQAAWWWLIGVLTCIAYRSVLRMDAVQTSISWSGIGSLFGRQRSGMSKSHVIMQDANT